MNHGIKYIKYIIKFKQYFSIYYYINIMGGGLIQLVTNGVQDKYLTKNPEITLFKNVYMRYTNFSYETFQNNFDGNIRFNSELNCTIPLEGDLLSKSYLVIILNEDNNKSWGFVEKIGFSIIEEISIVINGETIDTQSGEWLNIHNEMNKNDKMNYYFNKMIGNVKELKDPTVNHPEYTLIIPLQFWFCKNFGSAIPLICLNKNSIEIKVKLKKAIDCINYKGDKEPSILPTIKNIHLLNDIIFIDTNEKKKFINYKHEYLIEQIQKNKFNIPSYDNRYELKFYHPCKLLLWVLSQNKYTNRNSFLNWCFDNDWEKSRNDFAKLVWLATRINLSFNGKNIYYNPDIFTIGDSPGKIDNGNSTLNILADKIDAYLLFYDDDGYADASIDNVYLLSNEITYEDMTITIDKLIEDTNTTISQVNFFDLHKVNIVNYFNYGNFVNNSNSPIIRSSLKINGIQRFYTRDSTFFNHIQPYENFKNTISEGINIYSFCLENNIFQPTGACNFSKIDNTILELKIGKSNKDDNGKYYNTEIKNGTITAYTVNYNILGIKQGNIGLTHSN